MAMESKFTFVFCVMLLVVCRHEEALPHFRTSDRLSCHVLHRVFVTMQSGTLVPP